MMKKIALLLALTIVTAYTTNVSLAAGKQRSISVSPAVYSAISKYKQKNYTGAIQDLTPIVEKDENNAVAQYYLGVSYAQLGMKSEAQEAYNKVIKLDTDKKLVDYSKRAISCLNGQPQCSANYVDKNVPLDDMTVFIQSGKPLHDDVVEQIQKKSLDKQMDRINNDMAPDSQNYKYLNDASQSQPTDAEIANAVRILAKVGFNPLNNMAGGYTDPQLAALSAMLGNSNNNNINNMNYLPYMISQGSGNPDTAKQMIQSMMMSQMMPEMGGFGKF